MSSSSLTLCLLEQPVHLRVTSPWALYCLGACLLLGFHISWDPRVPRRLLIGGLCWLSNIPQSLDLVSVIVALVDIEVSVVHRFCKASKDYASLSAVRDSVVFYKARWRHTSLVKSMFITRVWQLSPNGIFIIWYLNFSLSSFRIEKEKQYMDEYLNMGMILGTSIIVHRLCGRHSRWVPCLHLFLCFQHPYERGVDLFVL